MTKAKSRRAGTGQPRLLLDQNQTLSATLLHELADYLQQALAGVTYDPRDGAVDRLFGLIMAQIDLLQVQRAAAESVIAKLRRQPQYWLLAVRLSAQMARAILNQARLAVADRRQAAQVAGLCSIMLYALRAWENDTSADLSATLRALDTALRRAGTAAAWLGFASADAGM